MNGYMKSLLDKPLTDYGYHRMTGALQLAGFYINHKKVYRLMKSAKLLRPTQPKTPKEYVKYRVVYPEGPLRLMEMDIKQVWVEGLRPPVGGYVLTILDVFTRCALYWEVGFGMKQGQVKSAWQQVIELHLETAGSLQYSFSGFQILFGFKSLECWFLPLNHEGTNF